MSDMPQTISPTLYVLNDADVNWKKRPEVLDNDSLAAINGRLASDPEHLIKKAEANTIRLTGEPRF